VTALPSPVAVVGLGLVGGSLARALRERVSGIHLVAIDPDPDTRARARREGVANVVRARVDEAVRECRLVVLGVPLGVVGPVLSTLAPYLAPEALLTDVVGLKAPVQRLARRLLPRARYVGSHPMAGGEHGGFRHSRADLFDGRTVVVCPSSRPADVRRIDAVWRATGARVVHLTPAAHDRVVAITSHLPYLAALGLVRVAEREHDGAHVAGRGFADATRRADFEPGVMAAVVGHNPHAPRALRAMARELELMAAAIDRDPASLQAIAEHARDLHRLLLADEPATRRRRR
jgi:prephenate dehydrogenase